MHTNICMYIIPCHPKDQGLVWKRGGKESKRKRKWMTRRKLSLATEGQLHIGLTAFTKGSIRPEQMQNRSNLRMENGD